MANIRRAAVTSDFHADALRQEIVAKLSGVIEGSVEAQEASEWAVDQLYGQNIPASDALLAAALRGLALAPSNLDGLIPDLQQLLDALTGKGDYVLKIRYVV